MKTTYLYTNAPTGPVALEFEPKRHRYWVREAGGERRRVASATSVTGLVSGASGALIYWAAGAAADHVRRSLNIFQPTEAQVEAALMEVANGASVEDVLRSGFGYDEIWVEELAQSCRSAHRKLSDEAKNVGTAVHDFAEQWILHQLDKAPQPEMPVNEQARAGSWAFLDWAKSHDIEWHWTERKVFSRDVNFTGTADIGMTYEGQKGVGDFKTSKAVYDNYHWQTAAYLGALREELGEEWEGRWIVHLDKRNGEFSVHVSPKSFEEDYEVFRSLRTAHQGIKGY